MHSNRRYCSISESSSCSCLNIDVLKFRGNPVYRVLVRRLVETAVMKLNLSNPTCNTQEVTPNACPGGVCQEVSFNVSASGRVFHQVSGK